MKVKEIMTSPVITVSEDTPVADVAAKLRRNRISAVPVVDDSGAVVGLISEHDLLARKGGAAREVMTREVITASQETDVDEVRHLLVERRIRRVPVVDGGRLVGIVSRGDVVALLIVEWACQVCGQTERGPDAPPERCPTCNAPRENFVLQEPPPGT